MGNGRLNHVVITATYVRIIRYSLASTSYSWSFVYYGETADAISVFQILETSHNNF